MSNGPLTPGEDPDPTAPAIDYSPATVAYNEAFENALMNAILYPSAPANPAPRSSTDSTAPLIPPTTLPVALDSPLRTHISAIPGVKLTHHNGYHTGGPGPSPSTVNEFAARFIEEHGIQDAGQLERVVEEKIKGLMDIAREKMREREEAVRKNEEVGKMLADLEVQRKTEMRVQEKVKEEREKKRG